MAAGARPGQELGHRRSRSGGSEERRFSPEGRSLRHACRSNFATRPDRWPAHVPRAGNQDFAPSSGQRDTERNPLTIIATCLPDSATGRRREGTHLRDAVIDAKTAGPRRATLTKPRRRGDCRPQKANAKSATAETGAERGRCGERSIRPAATINNGVPRASTLDEHSGQPTTLALPPQIRFAVTRLCRVKAVSTVCIIWISVRPLSCGVGRKYLPTNLPDLEVAANFTCVPLRLRGEPGDTRGKPAVSRPELVNSSSLQGAIHGAKELDPT